MPCPNFIQGLDYQYQADAIGQSNASADNRKPEMIEYRKRSFAAFKKAAELDPGDGRAFEYAIAQSLILREFDDAMSIATSWTQAASHRNEDYEKAKSLRVAAAIEWERSQCVSLSTTEKRDCVKKARLSLVEGLQFLKNKVRNADHRKDLEFAQTYELRGHVRTKSEPPNATAIAEFMRARGYYTGLGLFEDVARIDGYIAELQLET